MQEEDLPDGWNADGVTGSSSDSDDFIICVCSHCGEGFEIEHSGEGFSVDLKEVSVTCPFCGRETEAYE